MHSRIERLSRFEAPSLQDWFIYFGGFILLQVPAIINFYDNAEPNPYIMFAESLLRGEMILDAPRGIGDLIYYHGSYYLPYPPLPSLILLPFVAIVGAAQVNTVIIATAMACFSLYLIHRVFDRLAIDQQYLNWLIIAAFFGTGYWFAIFTSHHVYAFAHITSFLFQLLVINEVLNRRRWWLVGIFIGCSFLSRQLTLFYVLFAFGYMIHLHRTGIERITFRSVFSLCVSLGFFVVFYMAYNYARFGNPLDTGYDYIVYVGVLSERVSQFGVFSLRYVPFNFYSFFLKGFDIEFEGNTYLNIKDMDLWGTSLLAASPFLIASVKATWPPVLRTAAWLSIGVILTGHLLYHNNGYHQINTSRFALDFLPMLLLLTGLGVKSIPPWLLKGMIAYSILLNLISFVIHYIYQ